MTAPGSAPALSLRRNFVWTFGGNVVSAVAQLGKLVLLAKLGTTELVGQFTLGLAISAPVVILSNLGLRSVQATDICHRFHFSDYLRLRLLTAASALASIVLLAFVTGQRLEVGLVILAVGIGKVLDAVGEVFQAFFQQQERMDLLARSLVLRSVASFVGMAGFLIMTESLAVSILLGGLTSLAILFVYDRPKYRWLANQNGLIEEMHDSSAGSRWSVISRLAVLSAPLGLSAALVSLNSNVPRYFLAHFRTEGELGVYAALAYPLVAGSMVVNALGHSASPRLARSYASGSAAGFSRLLVWLLTVGVVLGVAGVVLARMAGRPILAMMYRPEYAQRADVFILLMVSGLAMYVASFMNYGVTACRSFRIQPLIIGAVVMTTFVACTGLVPRYGLIGAAWSVIISWSVQALLLAAVVGRRLFALESKLDLPVSSGDPAASLRAG